MHSNGLRMGARVPHLLAPFISKNLPVILHTLRDGQRSKIGPACPDFYNTFVTLRVPAQSYERFGYCVACTPRFLDTTGCFQAHIFDHGVDKSHD